MEVKFEIQKIQSNQIFDCHKLGGSSFVVQAFHASFAMFYLPWN